MKKKSWYKIGVGIAFLVFLEIVLRLVGFGQVPTYYVSLDYEYAMNPNQDLTRFGNRIFINALGMRSEEVRPDAVKILKFGDSILNGGVATDQSELTSSLLEADLNSSQSLSVDYQVLNVSAGSWGPDNAYAWMEKHGDFNAKVIVLLFSSHDWQDQMRFDNVVGNTPFYPDKKPVLAITDAAYWAYTRMFDTVDWQRLEMLEGGVPNDYEHNMGWDHFLAYANKKGIPLLVYHHADRQECENKKYNKMGQELESFLKDSGVHVISGLNSKLELTDYRDDIHPNAKGLLKIEQAIKPEILKILEK